jgi:hypothetical protein
MSHTNEIFYQDLTPKAPSKLYLNSYLTLVLICMLLSLIELIQQLSQHGPNLRALVSLIPTLSLLCWLWVIRKTVHPAPGSYFVRIYSTYLEYQGAPPLQLVRIPFTEINQCYLQWNRIDLKVDGKPWVYIQARGPKQAKMIYEQLQNLTHSTLPQTAQI